MELDNQSTRQTYVHLLIDTLWRKSEVLHDLMELTEQQDRILSAESFDDRCFTQSMDAKEEKIQLLTKLDDGFEKVYESIRLELIDNKEKYPSEINRLKKLITSITDCNVKIQAMESRNKVKLELILSRKRKDVKNSRMSSKTVSNYYKNMAKLHEGESFFYDKKN